MTPTTTTVAPIATAQTVQLSSALTNPQQPDFRTEVARWAQAPNQQPNENRLEAQKLLNTCYHAQKNRPGSPDAGKLSLASLNLISLPDAMNQLQQLKELNLEENQFSETPSVVTTLKSLKNLSFANNKLTRLRGEIGSMLNLEALYLEGNKLEELPVELFSLKQLRTLHLEENQLKKLNEEVCQLENLSVLCINQNKEIEPIPALSLLALESLVWLRLDAYHSRDTGRAILLFGKHEVEPFLQGLAAKNSEQTRPWI